MLYLGRLWTDFDDFFNIFDYNCHSELIETLFGYHIGPETRNLAFCEKSTISRHFCINLGPVCPPPQISISGPTVARLKIFSKILPGDLRTPSLGVL